MGADQKSVIAFQEFAYGMNGAFIVFRRIAEVPLWFDFPIRLETLFSQPGIVETGADSPFRHDDNRLPETLMPHLVQRDEHQGTTFAGGRR